MLLLVYLETEGVVPGMKKIFQVLTVTSLLLLLFAGCEQNLDQPQPDLLVAESVNDVDLNLDEQNLPTENTNDEDSDLTEPEPEIEDEEDITPPETKAVLYPQVNSTSTWAKTPTHFFFVAREATFEYDEDGTRVHQTSSVLYRLPLDDIMQVAIVAVPGNGELEVVGLSDEYLFVTRKNREGHASWHLKTYTTYSVSLATLQTTLIDSGDYFGIPWFHPTSNSILFSHANPAEQEVYLHSLGKFWLESLQLDTGLRQVIYEFESPNFASGTGWWQMEGDAVVFINSRWGAEEEGSDFILLDSELQAQRIELDNIGGIFRQRPQAQNPAEEFIFELGMWHNVYTTVGDWVYYMWRAGRDIPWRGELHRIRPDGTENMLVQANTDIISLLGVNNMLFATVFSEPEQHIGGDVDWHEAVKLSLDGSIEKVLGGGWHGHNTGFGIRHLVGTDLVMIVEFSFFRLDDSVQGLYCTNTGALFSLRLP